MKKMMLIFPLVLVAFTFFCFTPVYHQVSAAAEKFMQVVVTNWPEIIDVREQNLDENGNIKVHEQGTVNVNVANITPIPVSGDLGGTTLEPKLIPIFENRSMSPAERFQSDFINVEGYRKAIIYAQRWPNDSSFVEIYGFYSKDTSTQFQGDPRIQLTLVTNQYSRYAEGGIAGPYMYIAVQNNGVETISAWLYLIP